jgi:signal transduction histidine kinase
VDDPTPSQWLRFRGLAGSVRVRTTVAATAVVAVALAGAGFVLVYAMRQSLTNTAHDAAQVRAHDVASALSAGTPPGTLTDSRNDDLLLKIIDSSGRVVAESPSLSAHDLAISVKPGQTRDVRIGDERFVATAELADTADGTQTVIAARTLESVDESTAIVTRLLVFGLPPLLLLVAATTWVVTGRALAPVEAIRTEVDAISATALNRRVPQPVGRDEIARLASTMNHMLDRLDRAQRRQRRFVSDASHELRSPVASIREHAEIALAHPDDTPTAELAQQVLTENLRVQRLVEDLLMLARADELTMRLRRRPVDLDDVVFDEARRLRTSNDLRIDTTAVAAARVTGDEGALRRVVANLAENAARHARSRVAFVLREQDGSAVLQVEDDGSGIPEPERTRVFERFVRLDEARSRDAGGSGLGLAIVAQLVAAHDGTVSIEAGRSGGTLVDVRLPAMPEPG